MSHDEQESVYDVVTEAEMSLVSCVPVKPEILDTIIMRDTDFQIRLAALAWRTAGDIRLSGGIPDGLIIASKLPEAQRSEMLSFLGACAALGAQSVLAEDYAKTVLEASANRSLRASLADAQIAAKDGDADVGVVVAKAQRDLMAISRRVSAGKGFRTSAQRVRGERARRLEIVKRAIPYNVGFLDDLLRDILPNDLVLIGARTGAGKTALAKHIAQTNASKGRRVHYFALEAFEVEIELRIKYAIVAEFVWASKLDCRFDFNFPDWYRDKYAGEIGDAEDHADAIMQRDLKTLHTYYRGVDFTLDTLNEQFRRVENDTDLIILDHLHYVDLDVQQSENRAMTLVVKAIRDAALSMGKPVVCIAHLRKRSNSKMLVPDLEEFHGISEITKIATQVIMMSRARDQEMPTGTAGTYIHCPKDRMGGDSGYVALVPFSLAKQRYEKRYALGRIDLGGEKWTPIEGEKPRWAKNANNPSSVHA